MALAPPQASLNPTAVWAGVQNVLNGLMVTGKRKTEFKFSTGKHPKPQRKRMGPNQPRDRDKIKTLVPDFPPCVVCFSRTGN